MKQLLGVYFRTENQHEYPQSLVSVVSGVRENLLSLIEGCVDNKAGYGTLEAAESLQHRYKYYMKEGFKEKFDVSLYDGIKFDLRYQHYNQGFCKPHLSFRKDPKCALDSAEFLSKITKRGFPGTPSEFMLLLHKQRTYDIVLLDRRYNDYLLKVLTF
jgi:hypothetical protein